METSILTSKGQIVVPRNIRRKMNIKPGTRIAFIEKGDEIIIKPFDKNYFEQFVGILNGTGDVLEELKKEKRRERRL